MPEWTPRADRLDQVRPENTRIVEHPPGHDRVEGKDQERRQCADPAEDAPRLRNVRVTRNLSNRTDRVGLACAADEDFRKDERQA